MLYLCAILSREQILSSIIWCLQIVLHVEDQYVEDYKLPSTVWSKFFCNTIANNNSVEVNNDKSVAYVLKTCVTGYSTCGENTDSKLSIDGKLNLQAEVFSGKFAASLTFFIQN